MEINYYLLLVYASCDRTAASLVYRQAQSLDRRYGDQAFLAHLKEAGFSLEQIQTTERVLFSSKNQS